MEGRFTMSDDSHGIDQIGTNYPRMLAFFAKEQNLSEDELTEIVNLIKNKKS